MDLSGQSGINQSAQRQLLTSWFDHPIGSEQRMAHTFKKYLIKLINKINVTEYRLLM